VVVDRFKRYTTNLCKEITDHVRLNTQPLQTVFFGGGTPSLMPPEELENILKCLDTHFGIESDAEISMEADPGTFDVVRLRQYMDTGVSRFSVGIQSFDEVNACALN
jgi:coproporphyrinogen III oxidase-like Fe-S oxidoreductase